MTASACAPPPSPSSSSSCPLDSLPTLFSLNISFWLSPISPSCDPFVLMSPDNVRSLDMACVDIRRLCCVAFLRVPSPDSMCSSLGITILAAVSLVLISTLSRRVWCCGTSCVETPTPSAAPPPCSVPRTAPSAAVNDSLMMMLSPNPSLFFNIDCSLSVLLLRCFLLNLCFCFSRKNVDLPDVWA